MVELEPHLTIDRMVTHVRLFPIISALYNDISYIVSYIPVAVKCDKCIYTV